MCIRDSNNGDEITRDGIVYRYNSSVLVPRWETVLSKNLTLVTKDTDQSYFTTDTSATPTQTQTVSKKNSFLTVPEVDTNFINLKIALLALERELPELNQFLTLSPLPGFMKWMEEYAPITFERCSEKNCSDDELMKKAIKFLTESDRKDGMPNDPVGRFHVGNGASLERINLNADLSEKGLLQSYGVMANYLYDLNVVEENHETFFKNKIVPVSNEIQTLKKKL